MARRSIEMRLSQLDAQRKTLQARLGKQDRAKDTRRKILLGALLLHRLETHGDGDFVQALADWLRRELPGFLTREDDKALFADLLTVPSVSPASSTVSTLAGLHSPDVLSPELPATSSTGA